MKYIAAIILLILLPACSAQWHLEKALQKDPAIIDTKADTVTRVFTRFRDTSIHLQLKIPLQLITDTGKASAAVSPCGGMPEGKGGIVNTQPVFATSKDSIARARAWIKNSRLYLETWAVIDTTINYRDSLKFKQKEIYRLREITKETKAEIREKESFISALKKWVIIAAVVFFLIIITMVITMFKRK